MRTETELESIVQKALDSYTPIQEKVELVGAARLVAELAPKRIAELGVYRGGSLFVWHSVAAPGCRFVGVDTPGTPDEVLAHMRSWRREGEECELLLADSKSGETAAKAVQFLGGPIDFLFIDADHWYSSVGTEFRTWLPFVRKGGMVGFHDIIPPPDAPPHVEVWKLWAEIKKEFPETYEFYGPPEHRYGIGIVRV